jgi:hypothetical protein
MVMQQRRHQSSQAGTSLVQSRSSFPTLQWHPFGSTQSHTPRHGKVTCTHPTHSKFPEDTSRLSPLDTSVPNLRRPRVCVHLAELQLCLCSCSLWELCVANDVAECLSAGGIVSACAGSGIPVRVWRRLSSRFMCLVDCTPAGHCASHFQSSSRGLEYTFRAQTAQPPFSSCDHG